MIVHNIFSRFVVYLTEIMLQFPSQSVHVSQLCNYVDREKKRGYREREREMIVALKLQCTVKILFPNKQTITICL